MSNQEYIKIEGAYENNLKHISLDIPKKQITIFTGVSGSGKSSLVLDTIAASSRRELNETFPSFVQQYLPKYGRPHVDRIGNLPVAIVIDQRKPAPNARSTVGTYTDIYSLLRLLFSRVGKPFVGYSDTESLRIPSGWFTVKHARLHNLKDVTVDLPMGVLAVIAGVAGSGKSSLMECFRRDFPEEVIYISQKNIGISLRSTPATYLGVADDIRKLFAKESKAGLSMFTFNGKGGCPVCGGKGVIVSDMAFMDSIETVCEACGGLRYSPEALRYTVDGLTIAEVMDLTVRKASLRFAGTVIAEKLRPLMLVGLGYLHLNQALSTLSGGELQRVKLASYLGTQSKVFVLDEPTDGLHVKDVRHIISLFDSMVDQGNSVFLIEHNLDVLKAADYVIEIGPGGGLMGGEILFSGTPKELLSCERSVTKDYLV